MASTSVERWEPTRGSEDDNRPYRNFGNQNYVAPNLAPRAFEPYGVQPQRRTWKQAPPPPPDRVTELLRWSLRRPGLAMILAYASWLVFWSLYALGSV
jgi:hypothetical protein